MEVLHHPGDCPDFPGGSVVTIGAYDGVHIGHRRLLGAVRAAAGELEAAAAVVTFDRHPAMVVRPDSAPRLLTDLDQKLELLASTGVDYAVVIRFDRDRSEESGEDFVREVIAGCLRARRVIVGHDFHFGYRRSGDVRLLDRMGGVLGFDVTGVNLYGAHEGDVPVSSTRIRSLLAAGEVEAAQALLGRPHEVRGYVAHGDKRGRELGFPTANVAVPAYIALPSDGVYAGRYTTPDGVARSAALSLGRRPTFYSKAELSLLEAYILDFDGKLYDQPARVEFVARLRDQIRFDSPAELVAQIGRDVEATRRRLEQHG
jgi:riboflavin kinase/FMN adenylyltransferase